VKNGLPGNQLSKSVLRSLCGELDGHYFPAYEVMMDDLRDYRFYESDLIHPTVLARDYIWNFFQESFFTPQVKDVLGVIKKIKLAVGHRPFHIESIEHQKFVRNSLQQLEQVQKKLPYLNFSKEVKEFENQLVS